MPQIEISPRLPAATSRRNISLDDLNQLRLWMESTPEVPKGLWYKDFTSFKLCDKGKYPKTFLLAGQAAKGQKL